jgi:flagellar transcriptional activator FlhD
MYVVIKHLTKLKTPQACHGKQLVQRARDCFRQNECLTLDFEGVESIATGFFQEAIFTLLNEFGADFLKSKLQVVNMSPALESIMQEALTHVDEYVDRLMTRQQEVVDQELYDLNLAWLVKVRAIARENALQAHLIMGVADEELRLAVANLSMDDMQILARSGCLCFAPRFTPQFVRGLGQRRHDLVDMLLALTAG